jgi:hypothetical protein
VCILRNSVVDPDPYGSALIWSARSGSRWAKMTHKKVKKCIVLKCWMFSFEDCSPVAWTFFMEPRDKYIAIFKIKIAKNLNFSLKFYNDHQIS